MVYGKQTVIIINLKKKRKHYQYLFWEYQKEIKTTNN